MAEATGSAMTTAWGVFLGELEVVPLPTLVPIELEGVTTVLLKALRELEVERPTVYEVRCSLGAMVPLSGAEYEDSPETVFPLVVLVGDCVVFTELPVLLVPSTEVGETTIELDTPKLLLEEGVCVMLSSDVGCGRAGGTIIL